MIEQSAVLSAFRRVPIARGQQRMPVVSALPFASFVDGDTGLKQTTEMNWTSKYLNVEEIAAIVPIPDAVIDDAGFDLWGEISPRLIEAAGRTLDAAVFFGTNKPASWPASIAAAAVSAGNVVARGASTTAQGGLAGDISNTFAAVEADGFSVGSVVTQLGYRGRLRNTRDLNGQPLVLMNGANPNIYEVPVTYALNGLWPTGLNAAELFALDPSQFVVGVRQDFTFKVIDQGVITDNSSPPQIIYNLAQQDMKALRLVFRVAWQVANNITNAQVVEANRYPAAVLRSPAA